MPWVIGAAVVVVVWCLIGFVVAAGVGRAFRVGESLQVPGEPRAAEEGVDFPAPRSVISQTTPASI